VWRALAAGLLIALSTAGAVYASVQLLADEYLPPGFTVPVDKPEDGKPQTLMLIGSDRRADDGLPPRSDTIMLVRLDPDAATTTVTSIPRDLLVGGEKINAAYERDRERGTVRAVKRLLGTPDRPFPIHHVITADFTGFRETIDEVGCVYVDVDRRYFNDRGGPGGYAVIDIDPGYQKLCGKDALAYVRYRHADSDIVRGTRQQEFLRQLRRQPGVQALMRQDVGTLQQLARMARRSLRVDRTLRRQSALLDFADLAIYSATLPVRNVPFAVAPAPGDPNSLVASRAMRRRTVDAFLGAPPAAKRPRSTERGGSSSSSSSSPALADARTAGENLAIVAARRLDLPFYFPARIPRTSGYVDDPVRTYTIRDPDGNEHDAYRLVLSTNRIGEYLGVQGTTWRTPPILGEKPSKRVRRRGRTLLVYGDGGRARMVAWRTRGAAYWVSNSLSRTLSERELVAVAASLSRFGR
jgi:LCP family protein required for cell wall assembly